MSIHQVFLHTLWECLSAHNSRMFIHHVYPQCLFENIYGEYVSRMCIQQVFLHTLGRCLSENTSRMFIQNVYRECLPRMSTENVYSASLFCIHLENIFLDTLRECLFENVYRQYRPGMCVPRMSIQRVFVHTLGEYLSGYTSRMSIENVYRQYVPRMSIENVFVHTLGECLCGYTLEDVYRE